MTFDAYASSRLIRATNENNIEGVRASLAQGADPNALGDDCITALEMSVIDGYIEISKHLLEAGAQMMRPNAAARGIQLRCSVALNFERRGSLSRDFLNLFCDFGLDLHAPILINSWGRVSESFAAAVLDYSRWDFLRILVQRHYDWQNPSKKMGTMWEMLKQTPGAMDIYLEEKSLIERQAINSVLEPLSEGFSKPTGSLKL